MKNKFQKLAMIAGVLFLTQVSNAQTEKGFYVGFNAGYAGNVGGTTNLAQFAEFYNYQETGGGEGNIEISKVGLGKGVNVGVLAGYMFNKNIGAELGINYLMGSNTSFSQNYFNGSKTNEIKGEMLQFKPTLVLTAGYSKINPYAKFGLTIGSASAESKYTQTQGANNFNMTTEIEGGMSLGFHSGLGLNYALTSKISLFGEVLYTGITFRPETATVTEATQNGINVLPYMNINDIQTEFVDEYYTGTPNNSNTPNKEDAIDIPFNNIGFNVGLKYGF